MATSFSELLDTIWNLTDDSGFNSDSVLQKVAFSGPRTVLSSAFDVTGLATATVASALLAASQLYATRNHLAVPEVRLDSAEACSAFRSESLFEPLGWELPPLWDPIAGNYRTVDGWIRLHTNYSYHRDAVCRVLGVDDREGVRRAVALRSAEQLEAEVVAAGGAAAAMHTRDEWLSSDPGSAERNNPLRIASYSTPGTPAWVGAAGVLPLTGVRVLDLTRVIAGPVCTKFLAAYGADVLRIDPPGFQEVPPLLPETTVGKQATSINLTTPDGKATFEELAASSDVIVIGYRADALDKLGYNDATLRKINPLAVIAKVNAYGWEGPWKNRRGFDSLVQMSCGIAADGAIAYGRDEPTPLPAQALDHATGWLLAASITRALTRQLTSPIGISIKGSLVGTANLLYQLGKTPTSTAPETPSSIVLEKTETEWGPALRLPMPGTMEGINPTWSQTAGSLGRHTPQWINREQIPRQ